MLLHVEQSRGQSQDSLQDTLTTERNIRRHERALIYSVANHERDHNKPMNQNNEPTHAVRVRKGILRSYT